MTLDLHRLRLLREFASRGSIAATAAALGYTPSAVSQQLAALEREAGAALLDRTARSAELTDSGRRLAGHAEQLLASVGGAPPVPWEFEGLATILGLVSRSIGIAAIPALTLAAAETGPPRSVAPDDAKT